MNLLQSVVNVALVILLNPLFLLLAVLYAVLFVAAKLTKTIVAGQPIPWTTALYNSVNKSIGNAWADIQADPLAWVVIVVAISLNTTIGLSLAGAYIVLRKLGIKLP